LVFEPDTFSSCAGQAVVAGFYTGEGRSADALPYAQELVRRLAQFSDVPDKVSLQRLFDVIS